MFDISFSELMVIGAIALIVIGPARLPKVARTVGHLMGRAQRYVNDVKADIQREVELDDLRKFKEQMSDAARDVQSSLREGEAALRATQAAVQTEVESVADSVKISQDGPLAADATAATDATTAQTTAVDAIHDAAVEQEVPAGAATEPATTEPAADVSPSTPPTSTGKPT